MDFNNIPRSSNKPAVILRSSRNPPSSRNPSCPQPELVLTNEHVSKHKSAVTSSIVVDNDISEISFYQNMTHPRNSNDTTRINMAVKTEVPQKKGLSYDAAVRKLQSLTRTPLRKEDMMVEIQRLITAIHEAQPRRVVPPPFAMPRFEKDIEKEHTFIVRKIYLYLLTGNTHRKYTRFSKIGNNFEDLRFVDNEVTEDNYLEVIDFLLHVSNNNVAWDFTPKIMVLVKLLFSKIDVVRGTTVKAFSKICDTPRQLFLFVHLSQDYVDREGLKPHQELTREELNAKRLNRFRVTGEKTGDMLIVDAFDGEQKVRYTKSKNSFKPRILNCVKKFYEDETKSIDLMLYFLLKNNSANRGKINHAHLIRLSHPKFEGRAGELMNAVITYVLHQNKAFEKQVDKFVKKYLVIMGLENIVISIIFMIADLKTLIAQRDGDIEKLLEYWREYGKRVGEDIFDIKLFKYHESGEEYVNQETLAYRLTIHDIHESFLYVNKVWHEIIEDIPYLVLLEKLSFLFKLRHDHALNITHDNGLVQKITKVISNRGRLLSSKAHPVILIIHYYRLKKILGKLRPVQKHRNHTLIIDALYRTFNDCLKCPKFKEKHATHKRYCFAVDVTVAMFSEICQDDTTIQPIDAALAMLMCYYHYEEFFNVFFFTPDFKNLNVLFTDNLTMIELKQEVQKMQAIRTDCYLPVKVSEELKLDVDLFIILSADHSFASRHHKGVLQEYRERMHRPFTKMIVCTMATRDFNFADPNDPFMFDVCGFDENVPRYVAKIAKLDGLKDAMPKDH